MSKMGNHVSVVDEQWKRTFEEIKNSHDLAYCFIESAISLEEQEKPAEVFFAYCTFVKIFSYCR